jgi:hypothetical protein
MKRRKILALACLLTSVTWAECWAQATFRDTQRSILRGIKSISLRVSLDGDAQRCGITESLIHDAFMFPASSSKIRVSNDAWPKFVVYVATLNPRQPAGGCSSHVTVEVVNYQDVKLDYAGEDKPPVRVKVTLWEHSWSDLSGIETHGQIVRTSVEDATKKFLAEWNFANEP